MATSDVQLFGSWASPYSIRVKMALKLKSIDHEWTEEEIFFNKSERLLQGNPVHKKVPLLIHGKNSICESLVIVQYIDEVWSDGPSILPSDPYDRATARSWATYIDQTWFSLLMELDKASSDEARAVCVKKMLESLALLEETFVKCSKGGAFFGGDNVGYLDVVLGCYLGWFKMIEMMKLAQNLLDETRTPGLAGWATRFCSHDIAKDIVPGPQKLMEFYVRVKTTNGYYGSKAN